MIVKRFFDAKLAQASYLIGCGRKGSAIVIDPNRDTDQYLRMAIAEGLTITHVTETHIHADFVSGARQLAAKAGAALFLSNEGDADWKYGYAADARAVLIRHGDVLDIGNVKIDVVHTPGHTPEHLSFLVTDTAAADAPIAMVTGDFVFVGDVGRPDLLEKAARVEDTMEAAARFLYRSLKHFGTYPDWMQIWPGHGAGSACGKGLSSVPHSTVGYERRFNWAFRVGDESEFVEKVLAGQPEPPAYFADMKRINKEGPPILDGFPNPARRSAPDLALVIDSESIVVDTRPAAAYALSHIPGTINIPLNKSFNTWAGWLIPYDVDVYLITDESCPDCIGQAVRDLAMVGLDRIAGWFGSAVIDEWATLGRELRRIPHIPPSELAERMSAGDVNVIDVRGEAEWKAGHLPGVPNIPLGYLAGRIKELPTHQALVLQCQSGARSAIAASVLRSHGVADVINLSGGFAAWERAGYPVEREAGLHADVGVK